MAPGPFVLESWTYERRTRWGGGGAVVYGIPLAVSAVFSFMLRYAITPPPARLQLRRVGSVGRGA
jgi:hypothetical protein